MTAPTPSVPVVRPVAKLAAKLAALLALLVSLGTLSFGLGRSPAESPRETMREFCQAILQYKQSGRSDEAALNAALARFDWHGEERGVQVQMAEDLAFVLDRVALFDDGGTLPEAGAPELAQGWYRRLVPLPDGSGREIQLEFGLRADGRWLISHATVELIRDWWDQVSPLPQLHHVEIPLTPVEHVRLELVPEGVQETGFLLEHWQWLGLAALLAVGWLVDRAVRWLAGRVVLRLAGQQRGLLDRDLVARFERPVGLIVGALAARALLPLLDLESGIYAAIFLSVDFVLTVAMVWAAYRTVEVLSGFLEEKAALTENRFDDVLVPLLRRTLKIVVVAVGVVMIATQVVDEKQLWTIMTGLSIGSLAVGFAARDSIENLFGTFTVLLDKPFQLGDYIKMGEVEGAVEEVGFRSTRVRTPENSLLTVPNRRFIGDTVDNLGVRPARRVRVVFGLTYDTPPEKIEAFCEGVRELVRRQPLTVKENYQVSLHGFGASALDVQLVCQLAVQDGWTELRERHRLLGDVLRLAHGLGVQFAFPTQTVWMGRPEDLAHGGVPARGADAAQRGREVAARVAGSPSPGAPPPRPLDFQERESATLQ